MRNDPFLTQSPVTSREEKILPLKGTTEQPYPRPTCCLLLFVVVCCCLLLFVVVCCCLLLFVVVCCLLLFVVVCCCLFVVCLLFVCCFRRGLKEVNKCMSTHRCYLIGKGSPRQRRTLRHRGLRKLALNSGTIRRSAKNVEKPPKTLSQPPYPTLLEAVYPSLLHNRMSTTLAVN